MRELQMAGFDCDRTCPAHEQKIGGLYLCRFMPLLAKIGRTRVHSHSAELAIDFRDGDCLKTAVENIGGIFYGWGTYDLGDSTQEGFGFRVPTANGHHTVNGKTYSFHELVARVDGKLIYDNYGSTWTDITQIDKLKVEYADVMTEQTARNLGWLTERAENGDLLVHHPEGGILTITRGGQVSTAGFSGSGCHSCREQLGIAVDPNSIVQTSEACQVPATIQQR
jgi:hypothetical protein